MSPLTTVAKIFIMAATVSLGRQIPWRNLQMGVSPQGFFARTPSKIRQIVRICDVLDRFLRKPISFFQRTFSISGSMRLSSRTL